MNQWTILLNLLMDSNIFLTSIQSICEKKERIILFQKSLCQKLRILMGESSSWANSDKHLEMIVYFTTLLRMDGII